jgi:hypothetical protein
MNDRRKFLKGAGILGAFMGGVATPVIVQQIEKKSEPVDSALAPEGNTTMMLQGNPKPVENITMSNGYSFTPINQDYQNKVEMSVGKDNRLWIKVDDQWRRVAIDA